MNTSYCCPKNHNLNPSRLLQNDSGFICPALTCNESLSSRNDKIFWQIERVGFCKANHFFNAFLVLKKPGKCPFDHCDAVMVMKCLYCKEPMTKDQKTKHNCSGIQIAKYYAEKTRDPVAIIMCTFKALEMYGPNVVLVRDNIVEQTTSVQAKSKSRVKPQIVFIDNDEQNETMQENAMFTKIYEQGSLPKLQ